MPVRPFAKEDIQPLKEILVTTGVFKKEEIDVAVELMEIVVEEPDQRDYLMFTSADHENKVLGYYCVGPTPLTETTYDLYWLAVDVRHHGGGVGRELMDHCFELVSSRGGRKIIAETSSQASYNRTRAFYGKNGFVEESRIKDYYSPGDDLVIYTKHLQGGMNR
ncbi:MAG: GNAT family N-acetyltransferase [Bacteroidota bacterium]